MLLTLVLLCFADIALRWAEVKLSIDVRHIRSFPKLARELSAGPAPRVVFLGNSLTRHGVQPDTWTSVLKELNAPTGSMTKLVPDDTSMADWYYVALNNLIDPGHKPDLLILGFAINQLSDEHLVAGRLGAYFCTHRNIRELFARDLEGLAPKCDFLLGWLSRLYGVRDELQARFGDSFIPGYQESVRHLNDIRLRESAPDNVQTADRDAHSYELLERALNLWRARDIEVVLVAMPTPHSYEIDPAVTRKAESTGARLVDARHLPGLSPEDFPDGYHMGTRAAEIYTRFVAEQLANALRERSDQVHVSARLN